MRLRNSCAPCVKICPIQCAIVAMTGSHTSRRPRPIVSCLRCRHKKLKCDRKVPCENCVKAFTDRTCTYSRDGNMASVDGTSPSITSTASSIEDLQRRMAVVEQLLGTRQAAYEQLSESDAAVSPNVLETVTVKEGRIVYHGQNDRITLLNQVRLDAPGIGLGCHSCLLATRSSCKPVVAC